MPSLSLQRPLYRTAALAKQKIQKRPRHHRYLRAPLLRWLERKGAQPRIVGEFDDSALMKAFGKAGAGVFPAPTATGDDVESQYGVIRLGETLELRERFFAISVERQISHPTVLVAREGAQRGLFAVSSLKS